MVLAIKPDRALYAAFEVAQAARENIEIDPHAVGTHLEFAIIARTRRVGLKEGLGYIAVPEMVAPAVQVGIIKDEQLAITALEAQIKIGRGPERADFGLACRIGIEALPVAAERDRGRLQPFRRGMPRGERDFTRTWTAKIVSTTGEQFAFSWTIIMIRTPEQAIAIVTIQKVAYARLGWHKWPVSSLSVPNSQAKSPGPF